MMPEDLNDIQWDILTKRELATIYRDHFLATDQLDECSNMGKMLEAFAFQAKKEFGDDIAYIHPKPVCFQDDQKRANWLTEASEVADSDIWWSFKQGAMKSHCKVRIVLLATPIANWVRQQNWRQIPWHAWAIAIVRGPKAQGHSLFIYDCDAELGKADTLRPKSFPHGPMRTYFELSRKTWMLKKVFLGNIRDDFLTEAKEDPGEIHIDLNHCLGHTMKWIHTLSQFPDQHFDWNSPVERDDRWKSFVELKYTSNHYTKR
jgi:hypothetical protein